MGCQRGSETCPCRRKAEKKARAAEEKSHKEWTAFRRQTAADLLLNAGASIGMSPKDIDFVFSMRDRFGNPYFEPTQKQNEWLVDITRRHSLAARAWLEQSRASGFRDWLMGRAIRWDHSATTYYCHSDKTAPTDNVGEFANNIRIEYKDYPNESLPDVQSWKQLCEYLEITDGAPLDVAKAAWLEFTSTAPMEPSRRYWMQARAVKPPNSINRHVKRLTLLATGEVIAVRKSQWKKGNLI
jgi:hypothetical protein